MKDENQVDSLGTEATSRRNRNGWHVLLVAFLALPVTAILVWLWIPSYSTSAQDRDSRPRYQTLRTEPLSSNTRVSDWNQAPRPMTGTLEAGSRNSGNRQSVPASVAPPASDFAASHRLVVETSYREEAYPVTVPYTDESGRRSTKMETRTRRVPVTVHRWVPVDGSAEPDQMRAYHDERILMLAGQLRDKPSSDSDSKEEEAKLSELRKRLDAEFARMHERQAAEIEATQKRLSAVKEVHEKRGENQSQIVQRRIDQLLGRRDPLDWNYRSPAVVTPPAPQPPSAAVWSADSLNQRFPTFENRFQAPQPLPPQPYPSTSALLQPREPSFGSAAFPTPNVYQPPAALIPKEASEATEPSRFGNVNEVFEVIAKASEAELTIQSTKVRMDEVAELYKKGALPQTELRKATLEHETARKRSAVLQLQLQSIRRALAREVENAERRLEDIAEQHESRESPLTAAEEIAIQLESRRANSAMEAAKDALTQFDEAMRLVPSRDEVQQPNETPEELNPITTY